MSEFSDFIKSKRQNKEIKLRKMALDLGIAVSYLSDLESGKKLPPNSSDTKYFNLLEEIINYLELSEEESNKCRNLADNALAEKGYISNDMTDYMGKNQFATMALRKAKENKLTDEEWKDIINKIERKEK